MEKRRTNKSMNSREGLYSPGESEFQTSYARFFNPGAGQEIKSWKQKFNNADFGAQKGGDPTAPKDSSLIQWAGGLHQRADFNKRRDQLGSWTEVLFHH